MLYIYLKCTAKKLERSELNSDFKVISINKQTFKEYLHIQYFASGTNTKWKSLSFLRHERDNLCPAKWRWPWVFLTKPIKRKDFLTLITCLLASKTGWSKLRSVVLDPVHAWKSPEDRFLIVKFWLSCSELDWPDPGSSLACLKAVPTSQT